MKAFIYIMTMVMLIWSVAGLDSEYNIILRENGEAVVLITLDGDGVVDIPIYDDVKNVNVKGGIYLRENKKIELSIGSGGGATIGFVTNFLTKKEGNRWDLNLELVGDSKEIIINAPARIIVEESNPNFLIEEENDIKKLFWRGGTDTISVKYSFEDENLEVSNKINYLLIILGAVVLVGVFFIVYYLKRNKNKVDQRDNILKTLLRNEKLIVEVLLKNKNEMKRNELERESGLAKSSLASSLYNLERKKIVEIDKKNTVHFVKLARWFYEL